MYISAREFKPKEIQEELAEDERRVVYYPDDGEPTLIFTRHHIYVLSDGVYDGYIGNITAIEEWRDEYEERYPKHHGDVAIIQYDESEDKEWYAEMFNISDEGKDFTKEDVGVDDINKYLIRLTFGKCECKNMAREGLDRLIESLPEGLRERFKDYSIPTNKQYYGKIFLKTLKLTPEEQVMYNGKRIVGVHIRPYKIEMDDLVMKQDRFNNPFYDVRCYDECRVDYDPRSGNFHKSISPNWKDLDFQVVLVTCDPGLRGVEVKERDLNEELKQKVDEVGMYFPKISEPAEKDLAEVLKRAFKTAGIEIEV